MDAASLKAAVRQAMAAAASKKSAPSQTLTETQVQWMRGRRSDAPEALDFAHKKARQCFAEHFHTLELSGPAQDPQRLQTRSQRLCSWSS